MGGGSGEMGFSITGGGSGLLGAVVIAMLITVGAIVLAFFVTGAKQAHDEVVEQEEDERDARGE
jgi:uncharacterized membrane protein